MSALEDMVPVMNAAVSDYVRARTDGDPAAVEAAEARLREVNWAAIEACRASIAASRAMNDETRAMNAESRARLEAIEARDGAMDWAIRAKLDEVEARLEVSEAWADESDLGIVHAIRAGLTLVPCDVRHTVRRRNGRGPGRPTGNGPGGAA